MSGPEFFQTLMGKRFYETTLPELVKQLGRVADGLERLNKNLESSSGTPSGAPAETGDTTEDR
jgi:hypothetical protein